MSKTMLGTLAVICCGILLIPLLVDTTIPHAAASQSAAQVLAAAEPANVR